MYDLGATHSFISRNCVTTLQLPVSELPYDLLVSTPTNKPIRTSLVCMYLLFQIEGRTFVVNLIYLVLFSLDMILGMDWLFANHVMLNYSDKTIIFPPILPSKPTILINLYLTIDYCRKESQGYIFFSTNMVESDQNLIEIPVVGEYPDIFLEDIPEFPPEREIEFSIDLVLGTGPISIAPYRMSPLELMALKR